MQYFSQNIYNSCFHLYCDCDHSSDGHKQWVDMVRKELEFQAIKVKHNEVCDCIYSQYEAFQIEDSVSLNINSCTSCEIGQKEVDYDLLNSIDNDDLIFFLSYQTNIVHKDFLITNSLNKKFTDIKPQELKDKYAIMMIREQAYMK